MDTPVIAIARSIWWRNRRSFIVSAATLAVTAALYPLLFAFSRADWVLAASTLPLVGVFAVVWNGLLFVEEHIPSLDDIFVARVGSREPVAVEG